MTTASPRSKTSSTASTRPASSPTSRPTPFRRGLNEDVIRLISAKKNEPRVHARVAAEGVPPLADDDASRTGRTSTTRRSTTRTSSTTRRRSRRRQLEEPRRGRSRAAARPSRSSASRSTSRSGSPASRSTRCSTASRWPRPSRRSSPSWASSSARSPRRCSEHPELVQKYLGSVVPYTDNFFAALNSAVFTDGSFCYIPKGVRCPMELSTYFRINAAEHRPVRAHADRRRGGQLRQLPRGLHRADARREPAARRGGRAGRARRRADQVLDGAELVPRRQGGQGRHLQLRHQARQLPRARTRRSPGRRSRPARRSPGSTRAASCRATTRSASSTRWR